MFNLDNITTRNDSKVWAYSKLITGPRGSSKTNYLLNSIQKDNNIINIFFFKKNLNPVLF